jgi:hypothetical protein
MAPAVPCPAPIYRSQDTAVSPDSGGSLFDFDLRSFVHDTIYSAGSTLESWGLGAEPGKNQALLSPSAPENPDSELLSETLGVVTASEDGHVAADVEKARRVIRNNLEGRPPQLLPSKTSGRGVLSGALDKLGKVVETTTAIGGIVVEFKRDVDKGDTNYRNTGTEAAIAATQVFTSAAGGTVAGWAAAGIFSVAAGFSAPMWFPVAVGVAGAAATGYALSNAFDYLRREFKE